MYRPSFRSASRPLLVSAATAAIVAHPDDRQKLSIYPEPPKDVVLVETHSELEKQIGVARRATVDVYRNAHARVQGVVSRWIGVEHSIENRLKSLKSPTESLTPGILYVGIATLSGSILSRNRLLVTRVLLPPTLLVLSARYFLPETSTNVSNYLGSLEDHYFPTVAQKHEVAKAHSAMTWERVKDWTKESREKAYASTETSLEKLQDLTGLRLKQSLGYTKAKAAEVKGEVVKAAEEVKAKVGERTEEAKADAKQEAEEVKKRLV